jgi:hypothetical protein
MVGYMKQSFRNVASEPEPVTTGTGPAPAPFGSWVVLLVEDHQERGLGRVINATAEAAEATAVAFFDWVVPEGASLRVVPESAAPKAARFEANSATLLPVLDSLKG